MASFTQVHLLCARAGVAVSTLLVASAVIGGLLTTGSCLSTDAIESESALHIEVDNPQVTLRASRKYSPHTTWEDGEVTLGKPMAFVIPAQLPVVQGNSGNHKARLSFRSGTGEVVECDYRGGSSRPHPDTEIEYERARAYRFERCSNGATAGMPQAATWVKLHVLVGDQKDPAGLTQVQLQLGQRFGSLEPRSSLLGRYAVPPLPPATRPRCAAVHPRRVRRISAVVGAPGLRGWIGTFHPATEIMKHWLTFS